MLLSSPQYTTLWHPQQTYINPPSLWFLPQTAIHDKHNMVPQTLFSTHKNLNNSQKHKTPQINYLQIALVKKIKNWWGMMKLRKVMKFGGAETKQERASIGQVNNNKMNNMRERERETRKQCSRRNQHPNTWREGKLWKRLFGPTGEPNWRCFQTPLAAPPFYHGNSTPNMPVTSTTTFKSCGNY